MRWGTQSSGDTVLDLPSAYLFANATVTIYLWVEDSGQNPQQVYSGRVSRPTGGGAAGITLQLLQDMTWHKQCPPKVVDRVSYPDSPDVSQGAAVPLIYGAHRAPAMRSAPTTSP